MKKLLLLVFILISVKNSYCQNYIGLHQDVIIKRFGEPEQIQNDSIVYFDYEENGTNTYYFDANKKCTGFTISRSKSHLEDYYRMLYKSFHKVNGNLFISKSRKHRFQARIDVTVERFEIKIDEYKQSQKIVAQL